MYKYFNDRNGQRPHVDAREYDEFQGRVIVVDLATIDGQTEEFEGRHWLEGRVRERLPVGWDLEWQPDRTKDSDNPIALMQFSDERTALLLRTHRTRNWLPTSVMKALLSESCTKVGVGWDGPDKQKMQSTFNFQPVGIYDLSEIAKKKGIAEQGLKSLTEHFGIKMRKDSRIARSNWAAPELTQEQIQYAAEDAYFSFLLFDKLRNLPDPVPQDQEGYDQVNKGVLELQPGWEEQGIVRRHDGLWCAMCEKGPMLVPMVVARHMEGKNHQKKMQNKRGFAFSANGEPEELPDEYVVQGIICGDGLNELRVGEYKCILCNAGPFNNLQSIDSHLQSKKHIKMSNPQPEPAPQEEEVEKKDPFEDHMWNFPDYVTLESGVLTCTLCTSKATAVAPMHLHLGGDKHAKRCRSTGNDELIYIKERSRLEVMSTGMPVVRTGFKAPKRGSSSGSKAGTSSSKIPSEKGVAGQAQKSALPEGWEQYTDTQSGCAYFYNPSTKVSQWERPEAPRKTIPDASSLPPGWQVVMAEEPAPEREAQGSWYYADLEMQVSQWDPPPAYVHSDWNRQVDPAGRPFWTSKELDMAFYESDSKWQRLVDQKGTIYWSNQEQGIRFFEPDL